MMKYTIKNPRKIIWAMRDFVNSAHDLQYEYGRTYSDMLPENATPAEFLEWFESGESIYEKRSAKMTSVGRYCACVCDEGATFRIGYDEKDIACNRYAGNSDFAVDFYKRCPMGRGFANVTLVLLHELGHICTDDNVSEWDALKRIERREEIHQQYHTRREINFAYFQMPDEMAATNWAIEWLQDPEPRRMAKAFEKKFFACLEKK